MDGCGRIATVRGGGIAALLVLAGLAIGLAILPVEGAMTTAVGVQPINQSVDAGETTTVTVVLEDADGGVGQYSFGVAVANASVAEIVDVDYRLGPGATSFGTFNTTVPNVTRSDTTADEVRLQQTGVGSADTGSVALVTVTLRGETAGTTAIELVGRAVFLDESRNQYPVSRRNNATLDVTRSTDGNDGDGSELTYVSEDDRIPLVRSMDRTVEGSPTILPGDIVATPGGGYLFSDTSGYSSEDSPGEGRTGVIDGFGQLTARDSAGDRTTLDGLASLGGGTYAAGGSERITVSLSGGGTDDVSAPIVRKYDAEGAVLWSSTPLTETIRSDLNDEAEGKDDRLPFLVGGFATDVAPDGGGVIATGGLTKVVEDSDGETVQTRSVGAMLLKLDGSGDEQWNRSLLPDDADFEWTGEAVVGTGTGYLIAGVELPGSASGVSELDGLLVGTSGKELSWYRRLGGAGEDRFYDVVRTDDGNYVAVGTRTNGSNTDAWLVKVSGGGTVLRERTYGGPGDEGASGVVRTEQGNLTLAGWAVNGSTGEADPWLVHTTSDGRAVWTAARKTDGDTFASDITLQGDYYAIVGKSGSGATGGATPAGGSDATTLTGSGQATYFAEQIRCRDTTGDGIRDTDGDGLCDNWEANGFDTDGDDIPELDLPGMGADPRQKDIFVEFDYMDCTAKGSNDCQTEHDHRPPDASIDAVEAAFADAPVDNPGGEQGIDLHVHVDEAIPERRGITLEGIDMIKDGNDRCGTGPMAGHFGRVSDRKVGQKQCERRLKARHLTFHYGVSLHELPDKGGSGELGGNDFVIAVGWAETIENAKDIAELARRRADVADTTAYEQLIHLFAARFMHELGHNLGLKHGGRVNVDRKPNYLSVMNNAYVYASQGPATSIPGVEDGTTVRASPVLDYSGESLPTLDENALDESAGIQGPGDQRIVFYRDGQLRIAPSQGPIDWNGDGDTNDTVALDVNRDDDVDAIMTGYDDWANVDLDFEARGRIVPVGSGPTEFIDEPSIDDWYNATLGSPDVDEDGIANVIDNCPLAPNPTQTDANDDGIGDACTRESDPPVGRIDVDHEGQPTVGDTVEFNGSASVDPDGAGIILYRWSFGDGRETMGPAPTHTYDAGGTYTVTLTVEDVDRATNTTNVTLTVTAGASAPDVTGDGQPATDPDGDGLYEDVDGNGRVDVLDVAAFLEAFESPAITENAASFDFSGDGVINIVDVATLLDGT